jgi:hypothetical protein
LPAFGQGAPEEDIRGPKPVIEVPVPEPATPWLEYGMWVLLVLVVLGGLLWWILKKKRVEISAENRARRELDLLGRDGGTMEAGDFAAAASQVVRVFIERKFGLAAPRRTTEEFLRELSTGKDGGLQSRLEPLQGFLKACDLAKFAGQDLGMGERGELVARAREIVDDPVNGKKEDAA